MITIIIIIIIIIRNISINLGPIQIVLRAALQFSTYVSSESTNRKRKKK